MVNSFDKPAAQLKQDRLTGLGVSMNDDHMQVHDGVAYAAWNYAEGIADNGSLALELITGSDCWVHMKRFEAFADRTPWLLEIIEAPTVTTGVTPFVPINRLRPSSNTAESVVKTNPTGISGGTVVDAYFFGGGNGNGGRNAGTGRDTSLEIVLKQDTTYIFRITNLSGDVALGASLWVYFYEEEVG